MDLHEVRIALKMLAAELAKQKHPDLDNLAYLVDMAKMECDEVIERRERFGTTRH